MNTLVAMGRLDVAAAYRRLADAAVASAVSVVTDEAAAAEIEALAAVERALTQVRDRHALLLAARRGDLRIRERRTA